MGWSCLALAEAREFNSAELWFLIYQGADPEWPFCWSSWWSDFLSVVWRAASFYISGVSMNFCGYRKGNQSLNNFSVDFSGNTWQKLGMTSLVWSSPEVEGSSFLWYCLALVSVSQIFNTLFVQHWAFSLRTEYATDFYFRSKLGHLECSGAVWIQTYANVTFRGVKGHIPPLVPPFVCPFSHFDFHIHHVSWKRVAVVHFPWSGKQGDWDWKDHCSLCCHGPPPHTQCALSNWGSCIAGTALWRSCCCSVISET